MKRVYFILGRMMIYIPLVLAGIVAAVLTMAAAIFLGILVQR